MEKVIIEIDKDGWKITAKTEHGDFTEIGIITETGASHKGDLGELEEIDDELYETVASGFYCYDIANLLNERY